MGLVPDTNVAISALLWQGVLGKLIEAAIAGHITLVATIPLLAELRACTSARQIQRQLQARAVAIEDLLDGSVELVEVVPPAALSTTIVRDRTDDAVLAAALAGNADLIDSGAGQPSLTARWGVFGNHRTIDRLLCQPYSCSQ